MLVKKAEVKVERLSQETLKEAKEGGKKKNADMFVDFKVGKEDVEEDKKNKI